MLAAVLIFIAILLVLVLAHEWGHFITAKLNRVKVEEFAFGFPPRLFSIQKGETRYSFNLLPFGGFVKIKGEEGEEVDDPRSFSAQNFLTKIIIIGAGVFFNLLLAYLLFTAGFILGTPVPLADEEAHPDAEVRLTEIQKNSPAETAGLLPGDRLLRLRSESEALEVRKIEEVRNFSSRHLGKTIFIEILRNGEVLEKEVRVRSEVKEGEGAIGIAMVRIGISKSGVFEALSKGAGATFNLTVLTAQALFGFFKELFVGKAALENVSGPVGIINIVGDFSNFGFIFLLQLTALLSINLALINLIPFPGLDGGRIFLLILEKIRGTPFSWRFTRLVHAAGFMALLLLMIFITYHDILKLNS